ncbi:MAG: M56 family metallopeptidase [Henriciella sp.]|nr:M56 family metallopeptidase [Henriciella sp.]
MNWTDLHPFIQEAGLTTLAVGILVAFVLLIRRPFARHFGPKAAYALWLLPLARFVMPPLPANWSLSGWISMLMPTTAEPEAVAEQVFVMAPEVNVVAAPAPPVVAEVPPIYDMVAPAAPSFWNGLLEGALAQAPMILTAVWVLGALLWLGLSLRRQDVFQRLIWDDSDPASDTILEETAAIAKMLKLKNVPHVRSSLLCSGPLVTGLKDPVVLLPYWFEEDYTPSEQRDALIHELMHLKRRDLWAFQIARIVAAVQWFNPFAHIALKAFRTDQEAACDADVLNRAKLSPAAYGRTLVKAAKLARPSDRRMAAASLTLAHPIKERLIMMQHPTPDFRRRLMGTALAGALGAAAIFTTASCSSTAQTPEAELAGGPGQSQTADVDFDEDIQIDDDVHVHVDTHALEGMNMSINIDGETFEFSFDDLPPMPDVPTLEGIPGFVMFNDGNSFHLELDSQAFQLDEAQMEEFEATMEAWAEEMEIWGEEVEARAEAWVEEIEPHIEAMAEAEAAKFAHNWSWNWDRQAEQIERQAERAAEQAERMAERVEREQERAVRRVEREQARQERIKHQNERDNVDMTEKTKAFSVGDFNEVDLSGGFSVTYTQSPEPGVTAILRGGDWDDVEISVDDGVLDISRSGNLGWSGSRYLSLEVYAQSSALETVDIGSGSSFKGDLVADNLEVDASSGSMVSLSGACNELTVDASSGSNLSLGELECADAEIDASSGSSITVYASESVIIDASSGSSIRVKGNPANVEKDTSSGASVSIQ